MEDGAAILFIRYGYINMFLSLVFTTISGHKQVASEVILKNTCLKMWTFCYHQKFVLEHLCSFSCVEPCWRLPNNLFM